MTDITLLISAGDGPRECSWVVSQLTNAILKELNTFGLKGEVISNEEEDLPGSKLVVVSGEGASVYSCSLLGSIQWIGQSPFRPNHKRKNWFVGVSRLPDIAEVPELDEKDLEFSAMKASGPGGQHVNKTNSAVRVRHRPSGISTVSRDGRSQHANRKNAVRKLIALFEKKGLTADRENRQNQWSGLRGFERGNAVRCYEGPKFIRKK